MILAVELWIDDGNPGYLGPDIWVVPSDDPTDPPAMPYADVSAFVWARVHNLIATGYVATEITERHTPGQIALDRRYCFRHKATARRELHVTALYIVSAVATSAGCSELAPSVIT